MTSLSRRTTLKGLLFGSLVSVGLPPLEAMLNGNGTAWANGTPLPIRYGHWFFANGVKRDRWVPTQNGAGYAPSPSLQPFADAGVLDQVSIASGLSFPWQVKWAHATGMASIYTGAEPIYDASGFPSTNGGPRVDELIATAWNGRTRIRKLDLQISRAVSGAGYFTGNAASPTYNPAALFDLLFPAGYTPNNPKPAFPTARSRRALLDAVSADARALRNRLGSTDQQRLDQHLSSLEQLTAAVDATPVPQTCLVPTKPGPRPADIGPLKEDLTAINEAMSQLLTYALACDITRVFNLTFMAAQSAPVFWQLGITESHHPLGHDEGGNQPQVQKSIVYMMSQLAVLMKKLKAVPVAGGTLLDQCCIVASSEHNDPQNHGLWDIPALMIGKAGGALKGGVHHRASGTELYSKFLLTALRAVGMPQGSFGVGAGATNSTLSDLLTS